MTMRRRDFLAAAAAAGAGLTSGRAQAAEEKKSADAPARKGVLRFSCQEGVAPGKDLTEKLNNMEKWGFEGIEFGGRGLAGRVKEIKDALKDRPIKVSAICAGFEGWLIADDPAIRQKAMDSMKDILTAAGELGSTGMIIVPAFNNQKSLPHKEARELLTGFDRDDKKKEHTPAPLLLELGEHAQKAGTRVLLEPLNREECYFMRQLADAASMCRDVNHPGIALMGDFWHMKWEETSDYGAFVSAGDYLHHVHLASRRTRQMPGENGEADNYVDGFRGLKKIGYQDYCSFECGSKGDRMQTLPAAVKLLRDQWEQA